MLSGAVSKVSTAGKEIIKQQPVLIVFVTDQRMNVHNGSREINFTLWGTKRKMSGGRRSLGGAGEGSRSRKLNIIFKSSFVTLARSPDMLFHNCQGETA